jgi:uncharacterized protein YlxP (DUF503 family)
MKKNNLVFSVLFLVGALTFSACNSDATVSKTLKGRYNVKVSEINFKDLVDASKQAKVEIEKGKIELKGDLEKAQAELDKELNIEIDGKKVDLKEALGEMGQGLEKMMDGLGDMGDGLGKGFSEILIKNTIFQVDFRDDGALAIGSDNKSFNFSSKRLVWEVKDGKLIIHEKDQNKEDFSFQLTSKNDTEWELVNDNIKLSLSKVK